MNKIYCTAMLLLTLNSAFGDYGKTLFNSGNNGPLKTSLEKVSVKITSYLDEKILAAFENRFHVVLTIGLKREVAEKYRGLVKLGREDEVSDEINNRLKLIENFKFLSIVDLNPYMKIEGVITYRDYNLLRKIVDDLSGGEYLVVRAHCLSGTNCLQPIDERDPSIAETSRELNLQFRHVFKVHNEVTSEAFEIARYWYYGYNRNPDFLLALERSLDKKLNEEIEVNIVSRESETSSLVVNQKISGKKLLEIMDKNSNTLFVSFSEETHPEFRTSIDWNRPGFVEDNIELGKNTLRQQADKKCLHGDIRELDIDTIRAENYVLRMRGMPDLASFFLRIVGRFECNLSSLRL